MLASSTLHMSIPLYTYQKKNTFHHFHPFSLKASEWGFLDGGCNALEAILASFQLQGLGGFSKKHTNKSQLLRLYLNQLLHQHHYSWLSWKDRKNRQTKKNSNLSSCRGWQLLSWNTILWFWCWFLQRFWGSYAGSFLADSLSTIIICWTHWLDTHLSLRHLWDDRCISATSSKPPDSLLLVS